VLSDEHFFIVFIVLGLLMGWCHKLGQVELIYIIAVRDVLVLGSKLVQNMINI